MGTPPRSGVTEILANLRDGSGQAASELLPLLYEELRKLAQHRLNDERPDITLQATALVHEAYLRLVGQGNIRWENRGHFFAAAAESMRRILVERARKYRGKKHGGGRQRTSWASAEAGVVSGPTMDMLALDEALTRLEKIDPVRGKVVKLRFFAGLTIEQTAETLGISTATVERHWAFSRAWLRTEMTSDPNDDSQIY